jgi:hypothetical protein
MHISVISREDYTSNPDFQYPPAEPHTRLNVCFGSRLCKNVGRLAWDFEFLDFRSFAGPIFGILIFGV